jgi:hypothetical protein
LYPSRYEVVMANVALLPPPDDRRPYPSGVLAVAAHRLTVLEEHRHALIADLRDAISTVRTRPRAHLGRRERSYLEEVLARSLGLHLQIRRSTRELITLLQNRDGGAA